MIDRHLEGKYVNNFYGIIICGVLFITTPISILWCIMRIRSPQVLISTKGLSLGGWLIIIEGLILSYTSYSDFEKQVFEFIPTLQIFTGLLMLACETKYKDYKIAANTLLKEITSGKNYFSKSSFTFENSRNRKDELSESSFRHLIIDLKNSKIISFVEENRYYFITHLEDSTSKTLYGITWDCKHCGATDNTAKICDYCGTKLVISEEDLNEE